MTDTVTELAPGDIDRSGVSAAHAEIQPEAQREAAPMGEGQVAGIQQLAELQKSALDPSLSYEARDMLIGKIRDLSLHVHAGQRAPAWYGTQTPDPRATDTSPAEGNADEINASALATLTKAEQDQMVVLGKVQGLPPDRAAALVDFGVKAALDPVSMKVIVERAAIHHDGGWSGTLTQAEHTELRDECVRAFGSAEKAIEVEGLAMAWIEKVGLSAWVDANAGSLVYDPRLLNVLAWKARCAGLSAK